MDDTKMKYCKIILSFLILTNYLFADTSDVKIIKSFRQKSVFQFIEKPKVSTSLVWFLKIK